MCKTFHRCLCDLKYVTKSIKHICLLAVYQLYIGFVECKSDKIDSFYFRPSKQKLAFEKSPVGINTLNGILPNLCKEVVIKPKTAHPLRIACGTKLFNSGVRKTHSRKDQT